MKVFVLFVCLSLVLTTAFADTSIGNFRDPNHPGKCAIRPDLILSPGTHQNPSGCGLILCSEDGWAQFHGCGNVIINHPGCTTVDADQSLDYPECCKKRLTCPDKPELHNQLV